MGRDCVFIERPGADIETRVAYSCNLREFSRYCNSGVEFSEILGREGDDSRNFRMGTMWKTYLHFGRGLL